MFSRCLYRLKQILNHNRVYIYARVCVYVCVFVYTLSHDGMSLVFVVSGGNHLSSRKVWAAPLVKNMRYKSRREREACRLIASHRHSEFGTTCTVDHMFETDLNCCTKFFMEIHKLSSFSKLNKQTGLKGQHSFILFHFIYMWRTLTLFLASNSVLEPYFPLRAACLFSYGNNKYHSLYNCLINIVNMKIQSLNFYSRATQRLFMGFLKHIFL